MLHPLSAARFFDLDHFKKISQFYRRRGVTLSDVIGRFSLPHSPLSDIATQFFASLTAVSSRYVLLMVNTSLSSIVI